MNRDLFKWGAGCIGAMQLMIVVGLMDGACGSSGAPPGAGGILNPQGLNSSGASSGNSGTSSGRESSGGTSGSSGVGSSGASSSGAGGSNGGGGNGASGSGSGSSNGGGSSSGGGSDDGGVVGDGGSGGGSIPHGSCLDGITDYEDAGPFMYTATKSGNVNIWAPKVPAGCKVPVIHLSNGTGAVCADYGDALVRMATHGFLTTCYEDPNTGAGTDGITAFQTAISMYPDLADNKLGSTGHSQGGQAAFTCLQLAEAKWGSSYIYAGLAMEPASGFGTQPSGGTWQSIYGQIKSPMFMFSGTADMLVSAAWVGQAYSAMNPKNEVYWWSATGATHIPVPNVPEEQVSIPWFRWKLLGDSAACKFFKAIPGNSMISPGWTKVMSENEAPCQ
jgi:hypothetical protein